MTDEQPKRKHRKKPPTTRRLSDEQLAVMSEIFGEGFGAWYRETHDESGYMVPRAVQGLEPKQE